MRGPSVTGVTNGKRAQHLPLRRIKAAFRAGENGGRPLASFARRFRQRPRITAFVAEKQRRSRGQADKQFVQRHRRADLRHAQPRRLFRRFHRIGQKTFFIDAA